MGVPEPHRFLVFFEFSRSKLSRIGAKTPGQQIAALFRSVSNLINDLRYGVRVLLKSPAATAIAVLALALGIGVNISCFISIDALVLHPLPYPHLERIMAVSETVHTRSDAVAPADFIDFARQNRSFEQVAAYQSWAVNLTGVGNPEPIQGALVSPAFFAVLGSGAALGRTFSAGEAQPAHSGVVVVSQGFWRHQLAASPAVLGESVSLGGRRYTIVGVMQRDFDYPLSTDVWAPLAMTPPEQAQRSVHYLHVLGLLKPHVSASEASAEAELIGRRLARQYPCTNETRGMTVDSLRSLTNGVTSHFVSTLMGSAAFVLLLACANVANLQLVRAASRGKEIAVRAALGASKAQIARQLLCECVLIALLGGVLGLMLASWNLDYVKATIPAQVYMWVAGMRNMRIDFNVIVFSLALSLIAGVLCCAPAVLQLLRQRSRRDLNLALREGGRTTAAGSTRSRLQSTLIVSEIALALVLLVGAGFMIKSFQELLNGYYGYDPRNVLTFDVTLPAAQSTTDAGKVAFYDRALDSLAALPGARVAGLLSYGPAVEHFSIEGRPELRPGELRPELRIVSPGYWDSLRIPRLAGRFLSRNDRSDSLPAVVVSAALARQYWPHADAIGRRIRLGNSEAPWRTIVGISGDTIQDWLTKRPVLAAYVPYTQMPPRAVHFSLRTTNDPMQLASAARAAIHEIDRDLPVYQLKSMERDIFEETSGVRASANTMSLYAVIALLLAATGIFAVISYFVVQRTHDFGVRMALGANARDVLRLTLGRTLQLTALGLAIGLPAAFALMDFMHALLYGIVTLDWITFLACTVILAGAALLASYIPARRASKIDPLVALRQE